MIFLSFIYDQFLFPKTGANRCRTTGGMDRIDHALRWTIKISLFVLFFTLPDLYKFSMVAAAESSDNNENTATSSSSSSSSSSSWTSPGEDFFHLCSNVKEDDVDKFRNVLEMNPHWIHSRTKAGETCLHLTGIYGNTAITELLLHNGADPNIRTSFEKGLRMHPLSWNIYGGHLENVRLLLENGADVNADFDSMDKNLPVTITDVARKHGEFCAEVNGYYFEKAADWFRSTDNYSNSPKIRIGKYVRRSQALYLAGVASIHDVERSGRAFAHAVTQVVAIVRPKAKANLVRTTKVFDKDCQRLERALKQVKVCARDRLELLLCLQRKGLPSPVATSVFEFLV